MFMRVISNLIVREFKKIVITRVPWAVKTPWQNALPNGGEPHHVLAIICKKL
jgi:hypothetical protein